MKKNTKALVLGLIGAAAGVIALVVWLVVIAIGTGFYSTKIELSTVEGASEEGVQGVVRLHVEGIIDYIKSQKK